jgi:hypothetical protein
VYLLGSSKLESVLLKLYSICEWQVHKIVACNDLFLMMLHMLFMLLFVILGGKILPLDPRFVCSKPADDNGF